MNSIHRAAILFLPALILGGTAGPSVCATPANAPMSVLAPAGPVLRAERIILLDSLVIMLAIVIPTMIAIFGFAWWFRAKHTQARYLPNWEYSGRLELLVWSIPALVVLFLGGITWLSSHQLDPYQPLSRDKPLEVEVVALDWKWLFIYPEQRVASLNELVLPAGVPVHFDITSASVMSVFFVPRLGSEIYAMNGMNSQLNLQADLPGSYPGLAAHFNGDGFSDMTFEVRSVTPQQFSQWQSQARSSGPALDDRAYDELRHQGTSPRRTYRDVRDGLYTDIITQKLAPGLGPAPASRPKTSKSKEP